MLDASNVSKRFRSKGSLKHGSSHLALDDVSIEVRAGFSLGIVGESGSGKTTLARVLLGLTEPDDGRVTFEGTALGDLGPAQMRAYRSAIQPVFQDPRSSINPRRTVQDALLEPLVHLTASMTSQELSQRASELCEQVSLHSSVLKQMPAELSGGMLQRIAIARALGPWPRILICDEPVSALDLSVKAGILNLLLELRAEYNLGLLYISHDALLVRHLCDNVVVIESGKITGRYPAEQMYSEHMAINRPFYQNAASDNKETRS
jgi:ABC-type glutathione transport system ATPase component